MKGHSSTLQPFNLWVICGLAPSHYIPFYIPFYVTKDEFAVRPTGGIELIGEIFSFSSFSHLDVCPLIQSPLSALNASAWDCLDWLSSWEVFGSRVVMLQWNV